MTGYSSFVSMILNIFLFSKHKKIKRKVYIMKNNYGTLQRKAGILKYNYRDLDKQ